MPNKWVNLTDADREEIKSCVSSASLKKKMEHKKITVASAKGKGRNLQHWVCERISSITGIPCGQDDDSLIKSREMGQHGTDVILRGEAQKAFPFSIECKNSEQLSIVDTIEQVKANKKEGTDWLIIHKRKALSNPIVIIDWDTFERLVKGKK
jgi:hypothetical protein